MASVELWAKLTENYENIKSYLLKNDPLMKKYSYDKWQEVRCVYQYLYICELTS